MIKSTKMLKRLGATFLVVLMSIESFAAVVGDNDGAAFITKAEFDSMKNDFQSQLDRYNSSLDNKIDGAIASYLAGTSIAKTSGQQWLIGAGDEYLIIDSDKINDLEWGYADLDIAHIQSNPTVQPDRGNNFSQLKFERSVADANWEIFNVTSDKKMFLSYLSEATVKLNRASTFVRPGYWFPVDEADLPPNGMIYMRWHGGAQNAEPATKFPRHEKLPFAIRKWDGLSGSWSERLNDANWMTWYSTAFMNIDGEQKNVNVGIYGPEVAGAQAVSVDIQEKEGHKIKWIFDSGFNEDQIWTQPFDSDDGKNQVWAANCPNYVDYTGDTARKKSVSNPGQAHGLSVSFFGRLVGITNVGAYRDFNDVTWVEQGDYNHPTSTWRTSLDWCEFLFQNQKLKGRNLINENISNSILNEYASYGFSGKLEQGFPLGIFNDGNVIEFVLDTTTVENDIYIAFSTAPFSNGTTSKVYLENINNDSTIELTIDGTKQSKSVVKINPSKHKIKLTISTVNKVPVFWKMAYPSTMTKSPRKSFTIPKEYLLTA